MTRTGENIYYRKDGRFEGRYKKPSASGEKAEYHSIYGKTYEEVREKLLLAVEKSGDDAEKSNLTVNMLFEEWLSSLTGRVKEATISNYKMKMERHIRPAFGDIECNKLTCAQVYGFINSKLESGLSAKYVADIVVLLKSIIKYASCEYQLCNPLQNLRLPKKKCAEIKLFNEQEQKILQGCIRQTKDRFALGVALSFYTGIRIGELCALKWSDIDFEKKTLTVSRTIQRITDWNGMSKTRLIITEPKSAASIRSIPLPDCLLPVLNPCRQEEDFFVLSGTDKPIEPRTMQYRFQSMLKKANLPSVHFHALRHMFATNCIELGFDVKSLSEILGHSSVEITLNRYVHSSMKQKREYMKRFSMAG